MTEIVVASVDELRRIVAEAVAEALAGNGAPALFTREDAARYLAVSVTTLNELVYDGRLVPVRHSARAVRFRRAELDSYVAQMPEGP